MPHLLCLCFNAYFIVLGDSLYPSDHGDGGHLCPEPCGLELHSEHLFILHKFLNCPHWADTNLWTLLAGLTMEEFLAHMKTDVQQRMVDHMLETSKVMNGNDTVIFLSSDSEEEDSGSVIDLTEMVKVK